MKRPHYHGHRQRLRECSLYCAQPVPDLTHLQVEWDFRSETFMQGWVAYRTPKERRLPLASDRHTYERAGTYRALVKVIDIFGNDTSQAFDLEVR